MQRAILASLAFLSAINLFGQTATFEHIKIHRHRSSNKRVLVDKTGVLAFDDTAHKLSFSSSAGDHYEIAYNDIARVVFDLTTHMRGGGLAQVVGAAGIPGAVAGTLIARKHVNDYWLFIRYKDQDASDSVLLEVPKDASAEVIDRATKIFGDRVSVTDFPEKSESIKVDDLAARKTKQSLKVDRENHPLPETKPDKATVIVVCPPLAARNAGQGNQVKLHANDQVIAVNKMGTYSFAYLDPGSYRLVSQAENASGFQMDLEAGKQYYFLQNIFQGGFKSETALSRNSAELVMYLVDGSYHADWKPKQK